MKRAYNFGAELEAELIQQLTETEIIGVKALVVLMETYTAEKQKKEKQHVHNTNAKQDLVKRFRAVFSRRL